MSAARCKVGFPKPPTRMFSPNSKYDFSEDELLDKLAYFTLCKVSIVVSDDIALYCYKLIMFLRHQCLILVTTYFRFYTTDEATSDEANPANCEDGWTPYQRPIKSFLLDSWMFAAKGSQPPTISQMVDSVNWRDLEGGDRKAWAVCCQLQTWCTADVVALKLNLLFTPGILVGRMLVYVVENSTVIWQQIMVRWNMLKPSSMQLRAPATSAPEFASPKSKTLITRAN